MKPNEIHDIYVTLGENYDEVLERLMKPELVDRILGMFKKDNNMDLLVVSLDKGNAEDAFRAIHTVKGIALNLGFKKLAGAASVLTEMLRDGDIPAEAEQALVTVQEEYQKVIALIP